MKFFYFTMHNNHVDTLLADLFNADNVTVLDGTLKPLNNIFLRTIRKIHLSRKINRVIYLPFQQIWMRSRIPKLNYNEEYCFIFIDFAPFAIDFKYLKHLRKKSGGRIKYLLFLFNPVELFKQEILYNLNNMDFDFILSFDFADCEKYGFTYYNVPYSPIIHNKNETEKDLFLIC